jgi:uncharacterized membrane protein YgaE (UPF0421/DUF939 family)
MLPLTFDQLLMVIEKQDKRIAMLQDEIDKLKAWSDLNDHYLRELIEANAASTERLFTVINEMHDAKTIHNKLQQLEEEEQLPVAQLLKNFVEANTTEEERAEFNRI